MSTSFFKQGSNAKIMNNLCYYIKTYNNMVEIKNNKTKEEINLNEEEIGIINNINHEFFKSYYEDLILVKKGLEYIFNQTEDKFHKYLNINIKCSNIYTENALKEWINIWFNEESKIINNFETEKIKYNDELREIYKQFKKCRITIN
jgi:hypothetical protein